MNQEGVESIRAELLDLKEEAFDTWDAAIMLDLYLANSINNGDFDKLFVLLSKEDWAGLSREVKIWRAAGSEFDVESSIKASLIGLPFNSGRAVFGSGQDKILSKYFDLDDKGYIKYYEDADVSEVVSSISSEVSDVMPLYAPAEYHEHAVIIYNKFSDGTPVRIEAKFDAEKFGAWVQYNLVEDHYLDHMVDG